MSDNWTPVEETTTLRSQLDTARGQIAGLRKALFELRMRVLEADALATKDSDDMGFITAYHFKTGAWHRLLAYVNGEAYAALAALSAPAAEPEVNDAE